MNREVNILEVGPRDWISKSKADAYNRAKAGNY